MASPGVPSDDAAVLPHTRDASGAVAARRNLVAWSGATCHSGRLASVATAPNNGHPRPSLERPSDGLALESIHSNQIRAPNLMANSWVNSAMPDTSSGLQAPRMRVEQAPSLLAWYYARLVFQSELRQCSCTEIRWIGSAAGWPVPLSLMTVKGLYIRERPFRRRGKCRSRQSRR
jgi:hypothetical protein